MVSHIDGGRPRWWKTPSETSRMDRAVLDEIVIGRSVAPGNAMTSSNSASVEIVGANDQRATDDSGLRRAPAQSAPDELHMLPAADGPRLVD